MRDYYNEFDPHAAQWLRNLIEAGLLPTGDVDERDVRDVAPSDLVGYRRCHFFAGIGIWAYALERAGFEGECWTGSCPCQPFSAAGKGDGFDDERHLWPDWFWLISQCRPRIVFGEQVSGKDALPWFDLVSDDLEGVGYAVGAVDTPAASVGAPHIRQRLYWLGDADGIDRGATRVRPNAGADGGRLLRGASTVNGVFADARWVYCTDGYWRPVGPRALALADGASGRVGRLRAYGNGLCAPQAEEFVRAAMEAM